MALSTLEKAALKGIKEFEEAYLDEVFGKTPLTASTAEHSAATAAYSGYLAAAKSGGKASAGSSGGNEGPLDLPAIIKDAIKGQTITGKGSYDKEFVEIEDLYNMVTNKATGKLKSVADIALSIIDQGLRGLATYYTEQASLQNMINEKTSLTGDMSKDFRDSIMEASVYGNRLGISFDTIADGMVQLIKESGRFKLISESTINNISLQSKVFFDSFADAVTSIEQFQNVARGADDTMRAVEKAGKSTLELGLNAKTTVSTLVTNIDKLNQFGFKNGIEGLTRMVQKAQALRMDLNSAFNLAEKVMDPTNALSLAANLQVIGGALGDFNDPIKMMWMATNNVEGLQDALAQSAESLATFNSESGAFEVVGADLRRARAMADQLGMSLKDVTNLAVQSAQRTSAAADLMSSGIVMKEEDREFLTNIAQMKGGKMVIETKDQNGQAVQVALDSLTQKQADYLLSQKEQFKEMSTMDIAKQQVSLIENVKRDVSFLAAAARVQLGKGFTQVFEAGGYDPIVAMKANKELADETQKGMAEFFGQGIDELKTLVSGKEEPKSRRPDYSTPPTTTGNMNFTYTFKSGGPMFDDFMRYAMNNPEFKQVFETNQRSYLNSLQ